MLFFHFSAYPILHVVLCALQCDFTGGICDQYHHDNKKWRQKEWKKITLGYGVTHYCEMGGHEYFLFSICGNSRLWCPHGGLFSFYLPHCETLSLSLNMIKISLFFIVEILKSCFIYDVLSILGKISYGNFHIWEFKCTIFQAFLPNFTGSILEANMTIHSTICQNSSVGMFTVFAQNSFGQKSLTRRVPPFFTSCSIIKLWKISSNG